MRYPAAKWHPATTSGTRFVSPVRKVVHHKTVTATNADPKKCGHSPTALYGKTGSWPHFTVCEHGVVQHYMTTIGGRALKNRPGGVQTNADGVIQIEIVGHPRVTMPEPTAWHLVGLLLWLRDELHIPWTWPNGRPALDARGPHNRSIEGWKKAGQFGHCHVPENDHWDPAYTDVEWWWLNAALND